MGEQNYSSANTSTRTINKIYKILANDPHIDGTTIVDYGCGKYNDMKEFAQAAGYDWYGYDPYNRTEEENIATQNRFDYEFPDIVVCSNVLNVIDSEKAIDDLLKSIVDDIGSKDSKTTKYFFTIYEGDKSGIGKESKKDCWQRNERTVEYLPKLQKYFDRVAIISGESNIIFCAN